MSDLAIKVEGLGKKYLLFRTPGEKIFHVLGLNKILFWRELQYKEFWALREINLSVKKGERLGIIGRNGAGKSTLLKIITGNITPTEGRLNVNGKIQALMELGTGFHPEFTGRENIRASLAYQNINSNDIAQLEDEIIDFAELEDFIDNPVKTYSAGMYARLAFSTATVIQPDILIIDEILGAGDAYFTGKCVEKMKKLTSSGATVLFVSHDLASIQMLCERVVWIDRGRIRASGDPLQITKEYLAEVRKDDGLRLKARDQRIQKKNLIVQSRMEDESKYALLFHFVCDTDHPRYPHPIFAISITHEGKVVSAINVGDAMDNSPKFLNYIIDEQGFMDWGHPKKMNSQFCREYRNENGIYNHAPFQMVIPKNLSKSFMNLTVKFLPVPREDIFLEVYNGHQYNRIGTLTSENRSGEGSNSVELLLKPHDLPPVESETEKPVEALPPVDKTEISSENVHSASTDEKYGTKEVEITGFELLDKSGENKRVFTVGETLRGRIHFKVNNPVSNPQFVFCIYRSEGFCASQVFMSAGDMGTRILDKSGIVEVIYDPLQLGKGYYSLSIGIFKQLNLNNPQEEPSYCVWDRAIHFEIVQPEGCYKELGIVIHPVHWKLSNTG